MKIYLDTCSLQRPLDTKNQIRITLEAEAVLGILALCNAGQFELVSSEVLEFEEMRTPSAIRQEYAWQVLSSAKITVELNDQIEQRARNFGAAGIKPLDALHIAMAEMASADYFCTCDDQLLKRAKGIKDLMTKIVSPIELIEEVE